jgi:hypothetical protein
MAQKFNLYAGEMYAMVINAQYPPMNRFGVGCTNSAAQQN